MEPVFPVRRVDDRHTVFRQVTALEEGCITVHHRGTRHDEMIDQPTVEEPVEGMVLHCFGVQAAIDEWEGTAAHPSGESYGPEVLGPVGVDEIEGPRPQKPPQPQRIPERGWNVFRFQESRFLERFDSRVARPPRENGSGRGADDHFVTLPSEAHGQHQYPGRLPPPTPVEVRVQYPERRTIRGRHPVCLRAPAGSPSGSRLCYYQARRSVKR